MPSKDEKEIFNVIKRAKSFSYAFRGVYVFIATTRNAWIHLSAAVVVIAAGFYLQLAPVEWIAIIFSVGLVLVAEAINTAIEIDINLTSPNFHPYARDTKDVAAGAVLIASIIAAIVGLIIFLPKIAALF